MPPTYSTYRCGANLAGPTNRSISQDIFIPASFEEQQRKGIEFKLARVPRKPDRMIHAASSSTMDSFDRIGRDDHHFFSSDRQALEDQDQDESLIPGVGRGMRAHHADQPSPPYRRHPHQPASQPLRSTMHVRSPYGNRITSTSHPKSSPRTRSHAPSAPRPPPARVDTASDSADESIASSTSSSADDGFESTGNHRAFAATPAGRSMTTRGMSEQVQKRIARPILGEDTLNRVDFDKYTDSEPGSKASKKKLNEDDPTYTNAYAATSVAKPVRAATRQRHQTPFQGPSQDPHDPFHSPRNGAQTSARDVDRPRPTLTNAAAYQQHLNSRTLTSPAIRTLIRDRTKSPDSPSPAPSISGRIFNRERSASATRGSTQLGDGLAKAKSNLLARARLEAEATMTSVSAFEDMARKLQRDVELTRRANEIGEDRRQDDDAATASNSHSGSGYGAGSQVSSARTRVEPNAAEPTQRSAHDANLKRCEEAYPAAKFNADGYPAHDGEGAGFEEPTTTTYPAHLRPGAPNHLDPGLATRKARLDAPNPFGTRLPDMTGLTSVLASPNKARDGVSHVPIDPAAGSQAARLEELGHLRDFVDGLQTELDRAGERILNLEESQEMQKEEVDGLRKEVENVCKDVREVRDGDFVKSLVERVREEERSIWAEQEQQRLESLRQQRSQMQQSTAEPMRCQAAHLTPLREEAADETSQTHVDREEACRVPSRASPQGAAQEDARHSKHDDHGEAIQRLYSELEELRSAMEEQFQKATELAARGKVGSTIRTRRTTQQALYQAPEVANGRPRARHFSGDGSIAADYRDPWEAIEALRIQVVHLAGEVEKLNDVVVEELVEPRRSERRETLFTSKGTRISSGSRMRASYALHDNGLETDPETTDARPRIIRDSRRFETSYPASDPVHHDAPPPQPSVVRSSTPPLPRRQQQQHRSRVSFGHRQSDRYGLSETDADETIDAVAENQRRQSQHSVGHRAAAIAEDDEDISMIAEARAHRAMESMARRSTRLNVPTGSTHLQEGADTTNTTGNHENDLGDAIAHRSLEHDSQRCTVCSQARKSARRHQSRRTKALERERQREALDLEEESLLQLLAEDGEDAVADAPLHATPLQAYTLRRILTESWDEFIHQRMLYAELADELKHMSPRMGKEKRRILAEHVLDAVEALEAKADRINRLERLVESLVVPPSSSEEQGRRQRDKVHHAPASSQETHPNGLRNALSHHERLRTSPPRPQSATAKTRLTPKAQKKAMERLERLASHPAPVAGGRNSPPTINLDP